MSNFKFVVLLIYIFFFSTGSWVLTRLWGLEVIRHCEVVQDERQTR